MSSTDLGLSSLAGIGYVTARGSTSVSVMPMVGTLAREASRMACALAAGDRQMRSEGVKENGLRSHACDGLERGSMSLGTSRDVSNTFAALLMMPFELFDLVSEAKEQQVLGVYG
jgi:hypothetical protein